MTSAAPAIAVARVERGNIDFKSRFTGAGCPFPAMPPLTLDRLDTLRFHAEDLATLRRLGE